MDPLAAQLNPSLFPNGPINRVQTNLLGAQAYTPPNINLIGGAGRTPPPNLAAEDEKRKAASKQKWGALAAALSMGGMTGMGQGIMGALTSPFGI